MPTYTQDNLRSRINAGVKGKIGMLVNSQDTINQAVREVIADLDLRSTIRKTQLTPGLFNEIFQYSCPTDLKDQAVLGINPLTDRRRVEYTLVPIEQFMRRKDENTIALEDNDFIRKILINANVYNGESVVISELDALTAGGGTWALFGDGTNVEADIHNYVRGNGSVKYDLSSAGGTTAGIQNTSLNTFDLTDYLGSTGAVFVWAYITSATNLTNFILRIGSSSSNYYQKTTSTASDGTALRAGWNLLRFDLTSLTTVGTPDDDAGSFVAIYMTKTAGKISESDYAFDYLTLKKGELHDVVYYSKYGWQTSAGTYLENSTAISDLLNADTTEFDLFVDKGIEIAGMELDEEVASVKASERYMKKRRTYMMANPSQRKDQIQTYADFVNTD